MSMNINQVFVANPITSNTSTDLMYFGQSPYGAGNDAAMTYANFSAQFGAPFTPAALTKTNDTNITLTLGGTPATALLQAASITAGWAGTLAGSRGGLGAAITASNGGIYYSTATNGALLAGTATANLPLLSGATAAPTWGSFALSLGGAFTTAGALTTSGAFGVTFTFTNTTAVTFPTSGTLATTAQLLASPLTTKGDLWGWTTTNARLAVGSTDGQVLQVSSAAATGLAYSTPTYPTASGSAGQILRSDGTNNVYTTATFANTYAVSTLLYASSSNAVSGLATANSAVLVTNSTGVPAYSGTMTNGQVIIGSTGATPTAAALSQGTGITITNGAGTITIANSQAAGITNVNQNSSSATLSANSRYATNNGASLVTYTIPAGAAVGDTYIVVGGSSGGWTIAQPASVQCHVGSSATTSGATGTISSSNQYDSCIVTCVASNVFTVYGVQGNLTIV